MRVSIIIPALNEGSNIARTVSAAWLCGPDEVVVVDGGSEDDTVQQAGQATKVIRSQRGRAKQMNAGAEQATGDVLWFLHADNRPHSACVSQMLGVLQQHPQVQCGGFQQSIDAQGARFRLLEWGNAYRVARWGMVYGDQGIFVRRSAFDEAGRFADVPLMEDVMLMQTLRRKSRPVLLPGPLFVSPRRWQRHGVVRQTLRNWTLLSAFHLGVSPARLSEFYRPHSPNEKASCASANKNSQSE